MHWWQKEGATHHHDNESHKTVLEDSHQQGKMEQDSEDANVFQSRVAKAGYQEHVCAVKLTQKRAKLFLMPSWCQELPGFACLQTLCACEDSSTFACTHMRNQPHMGMVYCNSFCKSCSNEWSTSILNSRCLSIRFTPHSSFSTVALRRSRQYTRDRYIVSAAYAFGLHPNFVSLNTCPWRTCCTRLAKLRTKKACSPWSAMFWMLLATNTLTVTPASFHSSMYLAYT